MSTLETRPKDHGYNHWVKAALSLGVAKEGIENFVEKNTDQFHKDVINSLPAGASCRSCSTERSQRCPNSVCDNIRLAIINEHRFNGPAWRNTDCHHWCREPWELAKCFMSQGYKSTTAAADTDFAGLLSVVINHEMFDNLVTANLALKNNIFCQARDIRNMILHSPDMKLTDQELQDYITTLKTMLSDPKCLSVHPDALKAKAMLDKILNNEINITTEEERQVRALREIEQKKQEVLAKIETETDDAVEHVRKRMKFAKEDINLEKKKAIDAVKKELTDKRDDTVACVRKELTEAKDVIKVEKEEVREELTKAKDFIKFEKEEAKKELTQAKDEAIASLQIATQDTFSMKMKDMKTHLISIYQQDEHLSSPLFPLVLTDQRNIDELYVKPHMKLKDELIDSYKDLFKDKRRKIYVVGDAGLGKTSLCQEMVSTWCRVQAETIENMTNDEVAMTKFDFLFYISLREAATENDVEEMIKDQLLSEEFHEHLPTVLKEEKVLIILDGLDKWSGDSTVQRRQGRIVNKGIPAIRTLMKYGTILTTTRPWKLEAIRLKSTQIDIMVKLLGIADVSAKRLIKIMINQLNMKNNSSKKMEDFISELEHKQLEHCMKIPVVLKPLVCLWHSGKPLGQNMTTVYCQKLELLFELGLARLETDPKYLIKQAEWINSSIKLPACFDETIQCQVHKPLILALGKVAFQTLLSETRESSSVFERSQAEIHDMTAEDINICLKIGILSQSCVVNNMMSNRKISFLHKDYHEFFAALYVSVNQAESDECKSEEDFMDKEKLYKFINELRDTEDFDDPRYYNAYIDALKDGTEKTNSIRINVVGNAWVGKSTLTKNLLGMIPDPYSDRTDGIEVHCYKSNDNSDWSTKDVPSDEKTAQRIAKSRNEMQAEEQPIEPFNINTSHIVHQPNPTEIKTPDEPSDNEIVQAVSQTSLSESITTNDERSPLLTNPTEDLKINEPEKERINRFSSKHKITETEKEMINTFSSKLKEGPLTNLTCIQIWDFGGQFDYYATHQLFHSQRAVYLHVLDASADLNDITETCELTNPSGDKDVKYFCKFWMHSIHSFVGNDKNEPSVILVATKTDKNPGWNEKKQEEFFESVRQLFDGTPVGYHIKSKCFAVNNFSEDTADFKNLRQYIEKVAKSQDSWNSPVPTRWIPLEDSLSRRTSEKHLTLQQIRTIGSELKVPINDEPQIKAFLMYHHSLGNLVYFDDDDLSESVVIDPQWIIDAFKTLITAKARQYCQENGPLRDKWKQLTKEAILSKELIKAVWNIDDKNAFSSNEDILLKYLIKLGIISEVTELDLEKDIKDHKDYFFVPSLLNANSSRLCLEQLMEARTVTQTALVFAFEDNHVPLLLHHRLTAAALGKWNVLVFRDQRMLAENIGVYKLDEVHAGLIEVCDSSIEIKVVNLCGKYINPTQTDKLRRFVRFKIDAEFQRFSKTKTSPYTLRIRCNFNNNKGKQSIELSNIENSEYDSLPCPDNDPGHDIRTDDIRNQWSYPGVNIPRDKNYKELLKSLRDNSRRDLTLLVTEREFSKVACAIGFNWELLGIDLGLSKASIDQIKMDNPYTSKSQIFKMLKTWAEKEGEKASMEKLLAAIVDVVDMTVDWDIIRNILDE